MSPTRAQSTRREPAHPASSAADQPSSTSSAVTKLRTSHACNRCRFMRTKCSGGQRCTKCIKDNALCAYGDRKRERNKKDLVESLDRVSLLEAENNKLLSALRSLADSSSFRPDEHPDILELLAKYSTQGKDDHDHGSSSPSQSMASAPTEQPSRTAAAPDQTSGQAQSVTLGKTNAASSMGSPGRRDELARIVDLDRGEGATGFVGKMSEISWIQRAFEILRGHADQIRPDNDRAEINPQPTMAFIYFMDDTNLLSIDEDYVDAYQWPSPEMALILSEAFFHAMQGAFQYVLREEFFRKMFSLGKDSLLSWSERRWLAMANLVWAIGSKWLQMTKLDYPSPNEGHLVYYARARALGLDHRVMSDHPDLERVQGIGLLAFYLLINGSINRAWNTLGHATRHATALGLHLRVSDPNLSKADVASRGRTWYSLYALEVLIAEITGRPKSISLLDVTIPIEHPWSPLADNQDVPDLVGGGRTTEESRKTWLEFLGAPQQTSQHMTGGVAPWKSFALVGRNIPPSYFPQRLYLCQLSDKIASKLYSGTSSNSWSEVQRKIGEMQTELTLWAEGLPSELTFQNHDSSDTDPRLKFELNMYYHSVQMILHRPCLTEVAIEHESSRLREFNLSSARACVHGAMSMLAIMPDNPTAHEAYQLLPWWTLLHFVAQATAVLLMELCLDSQHFQNEVPEVVGYLRKAMAYLYCMTEASLSAYRAWRIFRQLLAEVVRRHDDLDFVDIPGEAPRPPGWTEEHEFALGRALAQG